MLQNKTDFHKKNFLKSGSVFAFKDQVWLMWGDPVSLRDRPAGASVCVCDFFLKKPFKWLQYPNIIKCNKSDATELLKPKQDFFLKTSWLAPEKKNFSKQFSWIQDCFAKGEIEKAVPYIFELGKIEKDKEQLLEKILVNSLGQKKGFLYGQWSEGKGQLGLTPEILIEQKSNSQFTTMAVAGTTSLSNYEEDQNLFLSNKKESKEHNLVVEEIKRVLKSFGQVLVEKRGVVKTPNLVHLRTRISVTTKSQIKIEDLVESLHPTPALGVFPRSKNDQIMNHLNQINSRGRFGAPFGFSISETETLFVVAIRNIEWGGVDLKIGSGCGVVPESQIDDEWLELKNKRQSVKQIFGLL